MSDDLLDCLLDAAEETSNQESCKYKEDVNFLKERAEEDAPTSSSSNTSASNKTSLRLKRPNQEGDIDLEDDEGYNEYGRAINHLIQAQQSHKTESFREKSTWSSSIKPLSAGPEKKPPPQRNDVPTDSFFGIRVSKPLISQTMLHQKMQGREAVLFHRIRLFVEKMDKEKDWVVSGVIVYKTARTSQKGNQFAIWTLSDLHGELKTVGLFLFGSAYKELWKCAVGTVIGVLNPTVFDKKPGVKDEVTLSVENAQRVMIFGQSKDLGTCKSTKKNGEKCTSFVNVSRCEYCIYHVKQEYQKFTKRGDLQGMVAGRDRFGGGLNALRNKVLGKNEVFYAGKSYTAIPATKNKKLAQKDKDRISLLNGTRPTPSSQPKSSNIGNNKRQYASQIDVSVRQRAKDLELLKRLGGNSGDNNKSTTATTDNKYCGPESIKLSGAVTLNESKAAALSVIAKLKAKTVLKPTENLPDVADKEENLSKKLAPGIPTLSEFNRSKCDKNEQENIATKSSLDIPTLSEWGLNDKNDGNKQENVIKKSPPTKSPGISGSGSKDKNVSNKQESITKKSLSSIPLGIPTLSDWELNDKIDNNKHENIGRKSSNDKNDGNKQENVIKKSPPTKSPGISGSGSKDKNVSNKQETITKKSSSTISLGIPTLSDWELNDKIDSSKSKNIANNLSNDKNDGNKQDSITKKLSATKSPGVSTLSGYESSGKNYGTKKSTFDIQTSSGSESNGKNDGNKKDNLVKKSSPGISMGIPFLSGSAGKTIDLNSPVTSKHIARAKQNALKWVMRNGPIKKQDPNATTASSAKRKHDNIDQPDTKRPKIDEEATIYSDRFKKIMAASSAHTDLLEKYDDDQQQKYFKKLEAKEKMEEKMATTYKVECKAVRCLQCKYTSFSAAERCKLEKHPLKVFDAMKRFFKCGDCGHRTVTLSLIPTTTCKNCGSSKWERTTMMKDIKANLNTLSIRGGEQQFINSNVTDANINLLMPDEE